MIIQYASDLHLEFFRNSSYLDRNPIKPVGDILILAGDVVYWEKKYHELPFFDDLSKNFKYVFYLPGNHEFYTGKDIKVLRKPTCELIRDNIYLVNESVINVEGTDLFFTSLFSNIPPDKELIIQKAINDFRKIKYRNKPFTVFDHNNFHMRSMEFLEKALDASDAKNKVVITHFVPSFMCNSERYKESLINDYFTNELHDFIEQSDIDYWIYGHNHYNCAPIEIGKTKLVTNQLGYVGNDNNNKYKDAAHFIIK